MGPVVVCMQVSGGTLTAERGRTLGLCRHAVTTVVTTNVHLHPPRSQCATVCIMWFHLLAQRRPISTPLAMMFESDPVDVLLAKGFERSFVFAVWIDRRVSWP